MTRVTPLAIISAVGLLASAGCNPSPRHAASLVALPPTAADDQFFGRNPSREWLSTLTGSQAEAPVYESIYFDRTASAGQGYLVDGAWQSLSNQIVTFAKYAPPGSRIEVFTTSQMPGQPEPVFPYTVMGVNPSVSAASNAVLSSRLATLRSKLIGHFNYVFSPVYEDTRFIAERAGESGMRSRSLVYSDLEQYSPSVRTTEILDSKPDALVTRVLKTMPRLENPPQQITAIRWPGYVGSTPLNAAQEDLLDNAFSAVVSAWGSTPRVMQPDSLGASNGTSPENRG